MKKMVMAQIAVTSIGATALATSSDANARWGYGWGWGAGAFAAGAVIGGLAAAPYYYPTATATPMERTLTPPTPGTTAVIRTAGTTDTAGVAAVVVDLPHESVAKTLERWVRQYCH